jgi:hypothetical protein
VILREYWIARTLPRLGTPVLALLLVLAALALEKAGAQSASLDGAWRGGGSLTFASGEREAVQCRARFSRSSQTSYFVTATCASASGRATQTATLKHVGGNNYRGSFQNAEYGVSGTISVVISGNRQTVHLHSEAGSARLELHR